MRAPTKRSEDGGVLFAVLCLRSLALPTVAKRRLGEGGLVQILLGAGALCPPQHSVGGVAVQVWSKAEIYHGAEF